MVGFSRPSIIYFLDLDAESKSINLRTIIIITVSRDDYRYSLHELWNALG